MPRMFQRSGRAAPLVVIVGPTGSGKSVLAVRVAEAFAGEIVNCDSLQLYRGFDIGTAKIPHARRGAIPHHLFDVLGPQDGYSAGERADAGRSTVSGNVASARRISSSENRTRSGPRGARGRARYKNARNVSKRIDRRSARVACGRMYGRGETVRVARLQTGAYRNT